MLAKKSEAARMNHYEEELEAQYTRDQLDHVDTDSLRLVRAWLADLLEADQTDHREVVALRGQMITNEIERRESGHEWTAGKRWISGHDPGAVLRLKYTQARVHLDKTQNKRLRRRVSGAEVLAYSTLVTVVVLIMVILIAALI